MNFSEHWVLPTGNAERNLGTGSTHAFLPLWL